jgi:hypothetical protein
LAHVLIRPSMASQAVFPAWLTVPPEILRLVVKEQLAFSEPLVWRGVRPFQDAQEFGISLMKSAQQAIEKDGRRGRFIIRGRVRRLDGAPQTASAHPSWRSPAPPCREGLALD